MLYLIGMLWLFLGIAIVSDRFMAAIEGECRIASLTPALCIGVAR